ncbi:hypothetical protein HDU98_001752 [Podochytrium sp. JEL0797]|nr:hypothetical protein HDU98_001752 [Podochytrium sp. JEL0797]
METRIIKTFREACEPILTNNDFRERRRTIKDLFLQRDYAAIFTDPSLLAVYVAEYSPSRALCYYSLFTTTPSLAKIITTANSVYCVGAGSGGEMVGITAARNELKPKTNLTLHAQDLADYSSAMAPIESALKTEFKSAKITCESSVFDILSSDPAHMVEKTKKVGEADVITAFFILNELLANSKREFVQFVKLLVMGMKEGACLVVVDSAGSFSEVNVGSRKKKVAEEEEDDEAPAQPTYMVYNLLDAIQAFEVVEKSDSQWYRFPEGLHYPIKLNNMRHFLRVYRKC